VRRPTRQSCPVARRQGHKDPSNSKSYASAQGLLRSSLVLRLSTLAFLLTCACAGRTLVRPAVLGADERPMVEVDCIVIDVESANDLPRRAENLGWVSVPELPSDEETAHALHDRVCAMGGNALTRVARVQELGESGYALKGNAWRVAEVPSSDGDVRHAR
jgi:hypothetical protein